MKPRALLLAVVLGWTLAAGTAKADTALDGVTIQSAPALCAVLEQAPSVTSVENIIATLHGQGYTAEQAGEIVGRAVMGWCPQMRPLLEMFVQKWNPGKSVAA